MRALLKLVLAVFLWSPMAWSSEATTQWKLIRDLKEAASNPQEFKVLKAAHPEYFANTEIESVTYATLKLKTFLWIGETTCQPDDRRLTFTTEERVICTQNEQGSIGCSSYVSGLPAEADPCL